VGIPGPRICLWERGEIELRPEQVEQIAKVLQDRLERAPRFNGASDLVRILAPGSLSPEETTPAVPRAGSPVQPPG